MASDSLIGIIEGLGGRYQERNKNLLAEESDRRKRLQDFWTSQLSNPNIRPEAAEVAFNKALTLFQTPYSAKLPKGVDSVEDFLKVTPREGESIQRRPSQGQTLTAPQNPMLKGVVPPTVSEIPAPAPGPGVFAPVGPYFSTEEREGQADREMQKKTNEAIRLQRAIQEAEAEFAPPVNPPTPFSSSALGIYDQRTGEVTTPAPPDTGTESTDVKNYNFYAKQTRESGGKPLSFDAWLSREATRRPTQTSATIQIANATQPMAGMPMEMEYGLRRAILGLNAGRQLTVTNTVNKMLADGNAEEARNTIRQAALESEPVAVRQQVQGRREVIKALTDIEQLLKTVPTNLIVGTVEDTARRLRTTSDPRYVQIGTRLLALNQAYRRSMTGAQFSIPEAQEYAQVFPSYLNTAPVNAELISGMKNVLGANDEVFWTYKLGPGWSDAGSVLAIPDPNAAGGGSGSVSGDPKSMTDEQILQELLKP